MTDYHTHPDYLALLRAVRAAGGDDLERLKLADWLDERAGAVACPKCEGRTTIDVPNRSDEAKYKIIGYKNTHPYIPIAIAECPRCSGTGRVGDGLAQRAEFIRVQCRIAAITTELKDADSPPDLSDNCEITDCPCQERDTLRRRERDLLDAHGRAWAGFDYHYVGAPTTFRGGPLATYADYSRGFVSAVRGPLARLWRACERCRGTRIAPTTDRGEGFPCPACSGSGHAGALAALGPEVLCVGRVEVTDREPAAEDYVNTLTNEEGSEWVWREDNGHLAMDRPHQIPGWLFDRIDLPKMRDFPTLKVAASPALARAALSAALLSAATSPYLSPAETRR